MVLTALLCILLCQCKFKTVISKIHLICFRNYLDFKAEFNSKLVVISGPNGSGKTNILEAISLLAPGRSFRNCKFEEILNNQQQDFNEWAVHGIIDNNKFSTGYAVNGTRKIKKNDEFLKSQAEILKDIKIIWLLPQMENIFRSSATVRRKFFDRICYNLFPEHAKNILRYEYYLQSRIKMLQSEYPDSDWLYSVESNLTNLCIEIQNSRSRALEVLNTQIENISAKFLRPRIEFTNIITPLDYQYLLNSFYKYRVIDRKNSRSNFGVHKTDFIITNSLKNQRAEYCSTGEQKALLVSFCLAQSYALKNLNKNPPIMLMDEILSHFDAERGISVIEELRALTSQILITTTKNKAEFFKSLDNHQCSWLDVAKLLQ